MPFADKARILLLTCASGLALATPAFSTVPAAVADPTAVRRIANGDVVGFVGTDGAHVWEGIPFAAPPTGPLRWRAPRPAAPWQGVRPALTPGPSCVQRGGQAGQEDCLYLNVWAPKAPVGGRPLPVMVWIHGGGNVFGQGADYDAGKLANSQNVIVVTVNYRLGVFGWFTNPVLRAAADSPEDRSGNYGTLDTIAALKWVRDNIAAFGGDRGRVTIFGESAGGCNVFALLTSPLAKGLFQGAIVQSGYGQTPTVARAENLADAPSPGTPKSSGEVLIRLLINDGEASDRRSALDYLARARPEAVAAYLRAKSFADFTRAYADIPDADMTMPFAGGAPQLFRDGVVLPREGAADAFRHGRYNRVPMIIGTNKDEYSMFLTWYRVSFVKDPVTPAARITDKPRFYLTSDYASRLWQARDVDGVAAAVSGAGADRVFTYRFDWDELAPAPWLDGVRLGATHGLDVPFVFGTLALGPEFVQIPLIQDRSLQTYRRLSDEMMSYWGRFAATGDPGAGQGGDLPRWRRWSGGKAGLARTMVLDSDLDGGVRMSPAGLTKAAILREIAADRRLPTLADRCLLLRDLLNIRGSGVTTEDYGQFEGGACATPPAA